MIKLMHRMTAEKIDAYLELIFGTEVKSHGELWTVVHPSPVEYRQYNYRSICDVGHPELHKGKGRVLNSGNTLWISIVRMRQKLF